MSSIIHALTGHNAHADDKSNTPTVHTAKSEDVKVQSTFSSQTQSKPFATHSNHKINSLMAKLGSTYSQIDEYSRHRTEEISEAVKSSIDKVVQLTQIEQQQLLDDAQKESNQIEDEYKHKLMLFLNDLDQSKATKLAELEKDLNLRQQKILENARQRIDSINEEANRLKMNVFKEAQAQVNAKIEEIAGKVAELEAEDTGRRLSTTTKTIIKTHAEPEPHPPKHA